jgi:hypothetical protein
MIPRSTPHPASRHLSDVPGAFGDAIYFYDVSFFLNSACFVPRAFTASHGSHFAIRWCQLSRLRIYKVCFHRGIAGIPTPSSVSAGR